MAIRGICRKRKSNFRIDMTQVREQQSDPARLPDTGLSSYAGSFNQRSGKFVVTTINAEFRPWLNKAVAPEFDLNAFETYVRKQGHDPVELRSNS